MKISEYIYTPPTKRETAAAIALLQLSVNHSSAIAAAEEAFNKIRSTVNADEITLYGFHFDAHDVILDLLGVMTSNESEFERESGDEPDPEMFSRDSYRADIMDMELSSIHGFIKRVDREMQLIVKGKCRRLPTTVVVHR